MHQLLKRKISGIYSVTSDGKIWKRLQVDGSSGRPNIYTIYKNIMTIIKNIRTYKMLCRNGCFGNWTVSMIKLLAILYDRRAYEVKSLQASYL